MYAYLCELSIIITSVKTSQEDYAQVKITYNYYYDIRTISS